MERVKNIEVINKELEEDKIEQKYKEQVEENKLSLINNKLENLKIKERK